MKIAAAKTVTHSSFFFTVANSVMFFISIILLAQIGFCLGSWEEVISFSGSGDDYLDTGRITLDYAEWKIVWEYQPDPETPDLSMFTVDVYEKQEDGPFLSIFDLKGENMQGVENVVNKTGDFYMIIETNNITQYSVSIQQSVTIRAGSERNLGVVNREEGKSTHLVVSSCTRCPY